MATVTASSIPGSSILTGWPDDIVELDTDGDGRIDRLQMSHPKVEVIDVSGPRRRRPAGSWLYAWMVFLMRIWRPFGIRDTFASLPGLAG